MSRVFWRRLCLLATLLVPATILLGASWRADAQPGGMRLEKVWKCSKCGGNLGNGVNPPSSCPHCNARLRAPRTSTWPDGPAANYPRNKAVEPESVGGTAGKIIAIGVVILAAVGLGFFIMKDWGA